VVTSAYGAPMDLMTTPDEPVVVADGSTGLRWSPAWVLEPAVAVPAVSAVSAVLEPLPDGAPVTAPVGAPVDTALVFSAGADRRVAIDGVDARQRAVVERWQATGAVPLGGGHGQAEARLIDRLVELGVVAPLARPGPPTVVADDDDLAADLAGLLTERGAVDLALSVRTGRRWPTVPIGSLHMGVDLSLHHTIVLGPLVAPGASACLACLDARAARRWPPPTVPPRPAVQRHLAVVAALLDVQLGLVASGASPLVNATIAWNLETGSTDRQALYKLAGCTRCRTGRGITSRPDDGRVALPWGAAP
jgi:hypothetical protein